jgi:RHS repeat-associated protein
VSELRAESKRGGTNLWETGMSGNRSKLIWTIGSTLVLLLTSVSRLDAQSWSSGYAFRRAITIDHTKVPNTDQANFPVLVSGTFPFLATISNGGNVTNPNGYDIVFASDAAGTTILPFEQESYSASTGTINYWVQVSSLSHTTDTVIYMFYGNGGVTTVQSSGTSVWDVNFVGVWHLANGTSLSMKDSTINGNGGTASGITTATGKINGAGSFGGSAKASFPLPGSLSGSFTIEEWANPNSLNSGLGLFGSRNPSDQSFDAKLTGNGVHGDIGTGSSWLTTAADASFSYTTNTWHHIAYVVTTSGYKIFVDGSQIGTGTFNGNPLLYNGTHTLFGGFTGSGSEYFNGVIDEIRLSKVPRTADWIATEYANENSPSTFYSIGNATVNGAGGTTAPFIVGIWPGSGPVTTPIAILGANFGTTQGSSTVSFNGVVGSPTAWNDSSILVSVPSAATSGNVVVTASGVSSNPSNFTVTNAPGAWSASPGSGMVGVQVAISGINFGSAQGSSGVTLNGLSCPVVSWSDTTLVIVVPSGATSGQFAVSVGGQTANSPVFTVTQIPTSWSDADIGAVGVAGSASYASGAFTIKGSGADIYGTADAFHFVYQPLNGDGTIVARLASLQGSGTYPKPGVMIRETLTAASENVFVSFQPGSPGSILFQYRSSTGGSTVQSSLSGALPWVKLVRSGNTFSGYSSSDGVNWVQVGSTQTITMASNVYVGLAVDNNNNSALATGVFDNVSVNSSTSAAPTISSVSATTGPIGSQIVLSGQNFGAIQGGSVVQLNGAAVTINSWSANSISVTVPAGATSGNLLVTVAPTMNNSNPVYFTVTTNPLPAGWLDRDVGSVALVGGGTFYNGAFTGKGAGADIYGTADAFHFVYQPLNGDGTIVARIVSLQGSGTYPKAGVMIRETLTNSSNNVFVAFTPGSPGSILFQYRGSTGGSTSQSSASGALPYWVKLVRSGNTFSGFRSPDGMNWVQIGSTQTISMATNVYVGLATDDNNNSALATSVIDNVSVTSATLTPPVITSVSATTGSVGSQVSITGAGFGVSQGNSLVLLNGAPMVVNSWGDTAISLSIATGAISGPLAVSVAPSMNSSNSVWFTITSQPLPSTLLDRDIGTNSTAGGATYSGGVFDIGRGGTIWGASDTFHFVYQPLSGDGTVIARVTYLSNTTPTNYGLAGVMIRETLDPTSACAFLFYQPNQSYMYYRQTAGTSMVQQAGSLAYSNYPYWVKLTRSGNSITGYISIDGVYWNQVGVSQTFTMAQNVYIGLAVANSEGKFDNVSIGSPSSPAPAITNISATTGAIGNQVVITGTGLGSAQNGSLVYLNGSPMTVNSWSATSVTVTVPTGATTGYLTVAVAPSMNNTNPIWFTVTANPLPSGWLDRTIGPPGTIYPPAAASFSSGITTVNTAGNGVTGTADAFHFTYQPLVGDGSFVARVLSVQGNQAGAMIRETLDTGSKSIFVNFSPNNAYLTLRATTNASATGQQTGLVGGYPYWVRVTRSGNSFSGYVSFDGVYWTQAGTTQTISMAQTVYIGLATARGGSNGSYATFTYDSTSTTAGPVPQTPVVTSASPTTVGPGYSVTITGSNFGDVQGSGNVYFNGAAASSISSWSSTQIVAIVSTSASSGPVSVVANGIGSNRTVSLIVYKPVITSLTPPAASTGGTVTIAGSGFGGLQSTGFTVSFNGVTASAPSWSDTSITAVVPSSATSGPVVVTESGVPSNGAPFTVLEPISVTGIAPLSGPVGSSVTISGTGFGPTQSNSTVSFYGTFATNIVSWSDTQIVATLPSGASSGSVGVTVAGQSGWGPNFTVTNSVQVTDSLGNTSTYNAAIIGARWVSTSSQGSGCSSCTIRGTIQNTYDTHGNVLTRTDELGRTTTYTYDTSNNLTSVSVPPGNGTNAVTSYTYNSFGEVLTATDPLGNVTTNTYDALGNLTKVTTPAPGSGVPASATQFGYDTKGELTTITDPLNHVTTLAYTPAGLIQTITDAQNNVTTYGYDAHGNRTSVTDALNHATTFAYDTGDRLTTITHPDTTTTTFGYDNRGRRTSVTDQNSKTTTYAYDDADRLISVTDAANNVTTYGYDTENNLTSITDANNHTTTLAYDAFGRVTQTSFPSNGVETYSYDAVGNLTGKTDRRNQSITYTYDQLNRLAQKQYPDNSTVNYTYDNDSRLTQVTDPTGTYSFTFDNMGRLAGTTTQYAFLTGRTFTTAYSYDAASNRVGFTDPEGGSTSYLYDTLNRLQTLTAPPAITSGSFGFGYDALSRRTSLTRPNAVNTTYSYDNLSRLLSVLHAKSGATIDGATYTVDNAGNRASKTELQAGVTTNYGYDNIYQLLSAIPSSGPAETYTYDPVGNRLSSAGVASYSYNSSNELTSTSTATYGYDLNGNAITKNDSTGITTFAWDFENRLTNVTLPGSGGTISFKYDPWGRRIYKSSSAGTSIYAYDDNENLVEETNGTGTAVARYSQGLNVDEPLAMLRSSATSYYQADGLGSITSLSTGTGALVQTYGYDSFGKQTSSSGSLTNSFQYAAREFDAETNLYYYRNRYYDPGIGRFISEDPIGFEGGINPYAYANNEPVLFLDPFGTSTEGATQTIGDLLSWLRGANPIINHVEDPATGDLSNTPGMQDIRDQYKKKGCNYSPFICNNYQYTQLSTTDNLTGQVVGSFCVKFTPIGNGRVLVSAQNSFGLESASRLPEFPGLGSNRKNPSIIDMLRGRAPLMYPRSIWNNKDSGWLRNMTVHYYWIEKSPCCGQ